MLSSTVLRGQNINSFNPYITLLWFMFYMYRNQGTGRSSNLLKIIYTLGSDRAEKWYQAIQPLSPCSEPLSTEPRTNNHHLKRNRMKVQKVSNQNPIPYLLSRDNKAFDKKVWFPESNMRVQIDSRMAKPFTLST